MKPFTSWLNPFPIPRSAFDRPLCALLLTASVKPNSMRAKEVQPRFKLDFLRFETISNLFQLPVFSITLPLRVLHPSHPRNPRFKLRTAQKPHTRLNSVGRN